MNVCFAVQEMNVPMSQYIEWPITMFEVRLWLVRWTAGTKIQKNFFTSPSQLTLSSLLFRRLPKSFFLKGQHKFKNTPNMFLSATNKSEILRQISTWMNRLNVCLMKSLFTSEKVMIAWKVSVKVHILLYQIGFMYSKILGGKKSIFVMYCTWYVLYL